MKAPWNEFPSQFTTTVYDSILKFFHLQQMNQNNSQALANIAFGLGLSQVEWKSLPILIQSRLLEGMASIIDDTSDENFCCLLSGFGQLGIDIYSLSDHIQQLIFNKIQSMIPNCTAAITTIILHELVRLNCQFSKFSFNFQQSLLQMIEERISDSSIVLSSAIYGLGMMGIDWNNLPQSTTSQLMKYLIIHPLIENSLSNTIYGLAMMNIQFNQLTPLCQEKLINEICNPTSYQLQICQHLSNTLWGLSKMGVTWKDIRLDQIESIFISLSSNMDNFSLSTCLLAMSHMDITWKQLTPAFIQSCHDILVIKTHEDVVLTSQIIANIMSAMGTMSFSDLDKEEYDPISFQYTLDIHRQLLKSFQQQFQESSSNSSNHQLSTLYPGEYYQFSTYFAVLSTCPWGRELMRECLGNDVIPSISGPSAIIPSNSHTIISDIILKELHKSNPNYTIHHEYFGLANGVYPIDCAVFMEDELQAFIEIDGISHYKITAVDDPKGGDLQRKGHQKEYIYHYHYPNIPFYRIRVNDIKSQGISINDINQIIDDFIDRSKIPY